MTLAVLAELGQYFTISSSGESSARACCCVGKCSEPGICFARYCQSPRAITNLNCSPRSNFCFSSSRLMSRMSYFIVQSPLSARCEPLSLIDPPGHQKLHAEGCKIKRKALGLKAAFRLV